MVLFLVVVALGAFMIGSLAYFKFSKDAGRNVQAPSTTMHFFDALFFGLGNRFVMNVAAISFIAFLISLWGIRLVRLGGGFLGSPDSYFGLCIAGIFFLIIHCRLCIDKKNTQSTGREPIKELFKFSRAGLTSPYLWLSRICYAGWLVGTFYIR